MYVRTFKPVLTTTSKQQQPVLNYQPKSPNQLKLLQNFALTLTNNHHWNNDYFLGVSRVVVVFRFDCTCLVLKLSYLG